MDGEGGKKFPSQCDLLCKPAEVEQMIQDASSEFRAGGEILNKIHWSFKEL